MFIYISVFIFLLGLLVGSFLNVVILRMRTGRSFIGGRSACLTCNETLRWFELIPIASFVWQKGKCVHCQARISWQYICVELLTAVLFVGAFLYTGIPASLFGAVELVYIWTVSALLMVIGVYDIHHKIIPNAYVYVFAALAFVYMLGTAAASGALYSGWFLFDVLAGPILALPLALFWLVSNGRWMGLGDAKLMLGVGWFLGLWAGFAAFVLSFWIGAIFGIGLIAWSKIYALFSRTKPITIKSEIPFGPFIIIGTLLVFYLNVNIFSLALLFL